MAQLTPLRAHEARKLSQFLSSDRCPPGSLSFNALKGFLFAIASGPAWIQQEEWMPLVYGGGEPDYQSDAERQFVGQAVARLYEQIHQQVVSGTPKMPAACKLLHPWQDNFNQGAALKQWSDGFLQGHMGLLDWWEDYLAGDEELQEALGMTVIILGFYADLEESQKLAKLAFGKELVFDELAETMRSYMANALVSYANIGQQLYQEHSEDQELRQLHQVQKQYRQAGDNVLPFPYTSDSRDERWHAQQLMYAAWDNKEPAQRIALAHEALQLDPDCVDAYLILANDAAASRSQVLDYLQQGVDAGERQLGDTLEHGVGHFWSLQETRPYMRARYGLAETQWELGQRDSAMAHFEALMRLNPEDNQGVRYMLMAHYLELEQYAEAEQLWGRFDDSTALWLFAGALVSFIHEGDSRRSRALRKRAKQANPNMLAYLNSDRHLPKELPPYYGVGDEDEAIVYTWYNRKLWRQIPGAMAWLQQD